MSIVNHFSKVFHDDALAQKISCPDNASVYPVNTSLVQLAPKEFQRLSQNNSGGTGAQSVDTEEVENPSSPSE